MELSTSALCESIGLHLNPLSKFSELEHVEPGAICTIRKCGSILMTSGIPTFSSEILSVADQLPSQ